MLNIPSIERCYDFNFVHHLREILQTKRRPYTFKSLNTFTKIYGIFLPFGMQIYFCVFAGLTGTSFRVKIYFCE